MPFVAAEIESQPALWREAAMLAASSDVGAALPAPGERVAVVGCGTSLYMAQSAAALREAAGHGETDAFAASEFPGTRRYDRVVAMTRSGTTTEILRLLDSLPAATASTAITTSAALPVAELAGATVALNFADEQAVVQTRFATTALALWRAFLGADVGAVADDAAAELAAELPAALTERTQFSFLGSGWTVGLANEAALKVREASQSWAESYPAMEFRHGPISVADERSLVWLFGPAPHGLVDEIERTGASVVQSGRDPMAHLVGAQRLAVAVALRKGLDPDRPRNLARSIVLT
ncbi:MAG TPA: sugar isomerase [Jatrophihabitans sp.]|nr:sugar isomerase [Jatrophihabitans sp.]